MTVEIYGEHAENAARALNLLIQQDAVPADPAAVDQMPHRRECVGDARRQRLHDIGLNTWESGTSEQAMRIVDATITEVRSILIRQILSLADLEGQAREGNEALETRVQVIEGKLGVA
jgi:hypothetical protein